MSAMPKVSVIIPTYNRALPLRSAVASVLDQTYKDFEIIVVQNGPLTDAKEIVAEFSKRGYPISYFHEVLANAANARNIGVQHAAGEYICFLDDDDEWLPEKLERQVNAMEASPEIGLLTCRVNLVGPGNSLIKDTKSTYEGGFSLKEFVANGCIIYSLSCVMARRKPLEQVGLFNTSYTLANDYEFYLRLAGKWRIGCVDAPLVRYTQHDGNASQDSEKTYLEVVSILQHLKPAPDQGVSLALIRRSIAKYFYVLATNAMSLQRYDSAMKFYSLAVWNYPFVGTRISWSKHRNKAYQLLRPYAAIVYCALVSCVLFFSANRKIGGAV